MLLDIKFNFKRFLSTSEFLFTWLENAKDIMFDCELPVYFVLSLVLWWKQQRSNGFCACPKLSECEVCFVKVQFTRAHRSRVSPKRKAESKKRKKCRWLERSAREWESEWERWRQKQSALYEITSRENSIISTSDVWTWLALEAKACIPLWRTPPPPDSRFSLLLGVVGRFLRWRRK